MVLVSTNANNLLSKLAKGNGHGEDSPYFDGWKAYDTDPFHPIMNPRGVIQMGLAENQVPPISNDPFWALNLWVQFFYHFSWWVCFKIAAFF